MQVTIHDIEAGLVRGVSLDRFTIILETFDTQKRTLDLPPDARKFIVHPDSILLWYWDWLMRLLAFLYFFEVCDPQ